MPVPDGRPPHGVSALEERTVIELRNGPLDGTPISADLARLVERLHLGGIDLRLADFLGPHVRGTATYAPDHKGTWLYRGTAFG
ncbi:hypothetical protein ACFO4E_01465 [Nocardiopsis mangrovi]|uniref:Uncharacterized protein n=1 Tax=Nocardiopsis mangrovi TaxID=1179818 RepID=A0ABV9DNT8_9ACTN